MGTGRFLAASGCSLQCEVMVRTIIDFSVKHVDLPGKQELQYDELIITTVGFRERPSLVDSLPLHSPTIVVHKLRTGRILSEQTAHKSSNTLLLDRSKRDTHSYFRTQINAVSA